MIYYEKYCKYKKKYLTLKKQYGGDGNSNDNIVAIGDLHGDIDLLLRILTTNINEDISILKPDTNKIHLHNPENLTMPIHEIENYDDMLGFIWNPRFINHTIIFTGDIIDGKRSSNILSVFKNAEIKMLRLINKLIIEAPRYNCEVVKILGNHELNALLSVQNDKYQFAFMDDIYINEGLTTDRKQYFRSKLTFDIDGQITPNNLSGLIIDNAKIIYEINNHIFSHAGFSNDPAIPINGITKPLYEILDMRRIESINNFVIEMLRGNVDVPIDFILPNNEKILALDKYVIFLMITGVEKIENLYKQLSNIPQTIKIPGLTLSLNMGYTHCVIDSDNPSTNRKFLINRTDDDFVDSINNINNIINILHVIELFKRIQKKISPVDVIEQNNELIDIPKMTNKIKSISSFLRNGEISDEYEYESLISKIDMKNNLLKFKKIISDLRNLFDFDAIPSSGIDKDKELDKYLEVFNHVFDVKMGHIMNLVTQFRGLGMGYVKSLLNIIKNRSITDIDENKLQQIIKKYIDNSISKENIDNDTFIRLLPTKDEIDTDFANINKDVDDEITKLNEKFSEIFNDEICDLFKPLIKINEIMSSNKDINQNEKKYIISLYEKIKYIYNIVTHCQGGTIENEIINLTDKIITFKNPFVSYIFNNDMYANKKFVIGHLPTANIKTKYNNILRTFSSYNEKVSKMMILINIIDPRTIYDLTEYKNILEQKIKLQNLSFNRNLTGEGITKECDRLYKIDCGLSKAFGKSPNKQQFLHISCNVDNIPLDSMIYRSIDIKANI